MPTEKKESIMPPRKAQILAGHYPGQSVFRSILPEDIEWKPFAALPPSVGLAPRRRAVSASSLCDQSQSASGREDDAT